LDMGSWFYWVYVARAVGPFRFHSR
jgi:hypothetical protein